MGEDGEADLAILPITPTAAQIADAPDLLYLPMWASAFGVAYSLPELSTLLLVLNARIIARIFMGNITMSAHRGRGADKRAPRECEGESAMRASSVHQAIVCT
jgi:ABC-type phosphate transport system substrate-binding protein